MPVEDSEDADQKSDGGDDDLPGLARTELAMVLEQLPE